MVAIHTASESDLSAANHRSSSRWKRLSDAVQDLHPSRKGTYSVERLRALRDYCSHTSHLRVLCVCLAVPTPVLLIAIGIESVPLQDPLAGWRANFGTWIRIGLIGFFVAVGAITQVNAIVPTSRLPIWKSVSVAVLSAVFYVFSQVAVASAWAFPIPFGYIIFVPIYMSSLLLIFVVAIGPTTLRKNPTLARQLGQQVVSIMAQASMCVLYPAFSAMYFHVEPMQQTALVFVLPVIKAIVQAGLVWCSSYVVEYIPGIVVFSVEVFNALYLTKCMQSAKSAMTNMAIMVLDLAEMAHAFHDMKGQLTDLQRMQEQYVTSSGRNLLDTILSVCEETGVLEGNAIRLHSSLELRKFTSAIKPIKKQFQSRPEKNIRDMISTPRSVHPIAERLAAAELSVSALKKSTISVTEKREFVVQSLKVMFQCEYHVLVEYVEAAIPLAYAVYVAVLCELPSAKYYPETSDLTPARLAIMVQNVLAYAWLEVLSLCLLHFAVKRKFGFSPMYVLAFVLENQTVDLLGRLVVWFAYVLPLNLVHFGKQLILVVSWMLVFILFVLQMVVGVDFTLTFAWMKNRH